jgi:hypothetical protein
MNAVLSDSHAAVRDPGHRQAGGPIDDEERETWRCLTGESVLNLAAGGQQGCRALSQLLYGCHSNLPPASVTASTVDVPSMFG